MSAFYTPKPVNPYSQFLARPAIEGQLVKSLERTNYLCKFVEREVNVIGAFKDDYIVPAIGSTDLKIIGQGDTQTIFIGEWKKHMSEGLYIRYDNQQNIVLVQEWPNNLVNGYNFSKWYFEWHEHKNNGSLGLTNRLSFNELQKVATISAEFISAINSYNQKK